MSEVIRKNFVVINRTKFCSPEEAEKVRQTVIKQLKEDGVAMLPIGFTAIVGGADYIFLGDE